jgi:hypothetical protein
MTIQKIKSGRVNNVDADNFVGEKGTLFFNESVGDLRVSDGLTVGGIPLSFGGGGGGGNYILPTASTIIKGGVKIDGTTIKISNQVISGFSGSYTDLTDKPTIPTNNTQLSNGAGYITSSALGGLATESYVTGRGYITTSALTGYALTSAIPTDIRQLTDTTGLLGQAGGTVVRNIENPFSFSIAGDDSTLREISNGESIKISGSSGITVTTDAEGNVTITGPDLSSYATQSYVNNSQATVLNELDSRISSLSYNNLKDKPNLAGTYSWSIAADDSTLRTISSDETVKFVGAGGITTASDAEGKITITGTTVDLSNYVTLDGEQTLTNKTLTSPTITNGVFQTSFTIGNQIFYEHGYNGFSVNEDFDIVGENNFTGYHYTSGAGREGVAFTLARTGQFTTGFGIHGVSNNNEYVIGSETTNTDFVFKNNIGMPFDVSGGTEIFRISKTGVLTTGSGESLETIATQSYVTTQGYITSTALTGLATESFVTSRGYITGLSWNQLTNKPNLAGTYSWSIAADDSTQVEISAGNLVKIVGARGVTTTSNADGQITITGPDLSSYATQSYVTSALSSAGVTVSETAPTGLSNGALWYSSKELELYVRYNNIWVATSASFSGDYNDLTNKPTKLSQFINDIDIPSRDEVYKMILELTA